MDRYAGAEKEEEFYPQFEERMAGAKRALAGFLAM